MTVLVDRDRVVLVPPPGASAVLSVGQTRSLDRALAEVAEVAGRAS
ncbi:hypothetical protein [Actinokineospora bangkokensis]|nr:hypothetical protein [Actinokineospora bangkokensis]